MHILSPETDNCPSWISRRERITEENISWSNLYERMLSTWWVLNPQPPDHKWEAHELSWAVSMGGGIPKRNFGPISITKPNMNQIYLTVWKIWALKSSGSSWYKCFNRSLIGSHMYVRTHIHTEGCTFLRMYGKPKNYMPPASSDEGA